MARLAEVVAALIVRTWAAKGCGGADGWLAALDDPRLSRAIAAMHKDPGRAWTVDRLAREAGSSRSVFAQRFVRATGATPLRYLTALRMRLAVRQPGRSRGAPGRTGGPGRLIRVGRCGPQSRYRGNAGIAAKSSGACWMTTRALVLSLIFANRSIDASVSARWLIRGTKPPS